MDLEAKFKCWGSHYAQMLRLNLIDKPSRLHFPTLAGVTTGASTCCGLMRRLPISVAIRGRQAENDTTAGINSSHNWVERTYDALTCAHQAEPSYHRLGTGCFSSTLTNLSLIPLFRLCFPVGPLRSPILWLTSTTMLSPGRFAGVLAFLGLSVGVIGDMVVLGGTQLDFISVKDYKKAAESPDAFGSQDIPLLFSPPLGVSWTLDISVAANVTATDDNLTENQVAEVMVLSLSNQDQPGENITACTYVFRDLFSSNATASSASDNDSTSCGMISAKCDDDITERFGGLIDNDCRFRGFPGSCSEYLSTELVQDESFWGFGMYLPSLAHSHCSSPCDNCVCTKSKH